MDDDERSTSAWPVALILAGAGLLLLLMLVVALALGWYAWRMGNGAGAVANAVPPPVTPEAAQVQAIALRGRPYVELADSEGLPDFAKDCTVEFWCRLGTLHGPNPTIYLLGNEAWPEMAPKEVPVPAVRGWVLRTQQLPAARRTWDLTLAAVRDGQANWHSFVGEVADDRHDWHHVAIVRDGTQLTLYVDGTSAVQADIAKLQFLPAPGPQYLGVRPFAHIDRVVSADFLAFRMAARPRYRAPFGPALRFDRDEADLVRLDFTSAAEVVRAPNRIVDLSGHRRHGTLHNGARWVGLP